jgi:hypothetical protein
MIEWNCNFNIEDSVVQLDRAYVKVVDYININNHSEVNVRISDVDGEIVVREYVRLFDRTFNNVREIYEELLPEFQDSKIINES